VLEQQSSCAFFQLGERRRYHNDRGEIVGNAYTPEGGIYVVVFVPIAGIAGQRDP